MFGGSVTKRKKVKMYNGKSNHFFNGSSFNLYKLKSGKFFKLLSLWKPLLKNMYLYGKRVKGIFTFIIEEKVSV